MRRYSPLLLIFLISILLACASQPPSENLAQGGSAGAPAGAPAGGKEAGKESASKPGMLSKMMAKPVVPAGEHIIVKLDQAVGSKLSKTGDTFTATVAEPIEKDGKTLIPAGSQASGTVADAAPLGKFKGGAVLRVILNQVTVNGTNYKIETEAVSRYEKGKGKRTAVAVGGGAGLGAIIGGIAGGGKGAAIGAAAGAGAGTAGAAFTGNKEIVLPAESAVSFKLVQPLELK